MISGQVLEDDRFLRLSNEAQNLYVHLCLHADSEGFVGQAIALIDMLSFQKDVLWELKLSNFIILFNSGVVVIKHWNLMNNLTYKNPTAYRDERQLLKMKNNQVYSLNEGMALGNRELKVLSDDEFSILQKIANERWC